MSIDPNPAIAQLQRASEDMHGRDRFVRLDRNERVTPFSDVEFAGILAGLRAERFSAYPDPSPLVDRLSRALSVPASWIYLTNGSDAAIRKVFQTYLRPGDKVLLADPTYAMYPIYTQMFGGRADTVSYGDDRTLDVAAFRRRLERQPRIVAIACPDQPTGAVLSLPDLRAIASDARDQGTLCIVDEAYYPFHAITAISLAGELDNVVITRTFSKVGGLAGLRLGYLVARPEIVTHVDKVRGAHEVNAMAIHAGAYVLDHPEIGDAFVRDIEAGRAVLRNAAVELGMRVPPCPANFQLIELPPALDPSAVVEALKDRGYLVKGGFRHPSVARCLRVTLAGPGVIVPFTDALREVCARAAA
jgi:histidinol-phosphate aminotransferase